MIGKLLVDVMNEKYHCFNWFLLYLNNKINKGVNEVGKNLNKKRLYIFLGIVFMLSWGWVAIIPLTGNNYGSTKSMIILSILMLIPALSSILTRLITKEGFKNIYLKPKFKKNIKYYLMAYFMTNVFILLGGVVFFMIFPNMLDTNLTSLKAVLESQGLNVNANIILISQFTQGILIGPIINIIFTLGEEIGWRGYLLQKLCKQFSVQKSIVISGVIWGIWHAPIIAMGHNYGTGYIGEPWLGIFAMIVFCIVVGTYFSYLTIKTKSVIPAGIAHSAMNAFAGFAIILCKKIANPFIGPSPTGVIGGSIFILVAVYCYMKLEKIENPFEEETIINN